MTTIAVDPADRPAAAADLWDRVRALVADLDESQWERQTPCPEWTVRDLVAHLSGLQTAFDGTAPQPSPPDGWAPPEGSPPQDAWTAAGVVARRDWPVEQLQDELRVARDGHVARLTSGGDWEAETHGPTGKTTEEGLFAVRSYDVWVHIQDLREALGLDVEAGDPSPGARAAYGFVLNLVPWLYAKRVEAPDPSALRVRLREPLNFDRVLSLQERRARWVDEADPGRCVVDVDPAALVLLVSGRGTPEGWRDAGLLDWDGDRGEEFVARARLFA